MNIGLISLSLFFLGVVIVAYFVAQKYLYQGFDNNNRCSLITFMIVLTSSIGLLMMIVVEIMSLENETFRLNMWIMIIGTLNYSMLLVVPLLIIYKSCKKLFESGWVVVFVFSTSIHLLVVFYFLTREVCLNYKVEKTWFNMLYYSVYIMKPDVQFNLLSKIGVCMISTLSGFGCVYMPFQMFRYYNPLITQINKDKIEEDMRILLQETIGESLELSRISQDFNFYGKSEKKSSGFFGKMMGSLFGSADSKQERDVKQHMKNIKLNQSLLDSLFIDYSEISNEERIFKNAKTQKLRNYFYKSCAFMLLSFGLYKVITTISNLAMGRKEPTDPISNCLKLMAKWLHITVDKNTTEMITSYGSLLFMGGLIISNIRGFALNFLKFLRYFFKSFLSEFITGEIILLLSTEIVGIYFLSTFFLMLNSLPDKYKETTNKMLMDIDYFRIYWNFDLVFLFSTIISFCVLWFNLKTRHFKYTSYAHKDE